MVYLLDTNVVIHYLHDRPDVCNAYENAILGGNKVVIPKMVDYEVKRGFYIKPNPRKETSYDSFLAYCDIVDINTDIWKHAIPIYAGHYNRRHTADEIDILIAALVIQNDFTLVTSNVKDYQHVDGLKWVNWAG